MAYSTKFFTPFGEYRIDPPSPTEDISDRGFTGHKHNDDLELIYMNARFYVPQIGRFASADTIIPVPTDPQSHNRFSYVRNNPLNLVDPTGHKFEMDETTGCDYNSGCPTWQEIEEFNQWKEENGCAAVIVVGCVDEEGNYVPTEAFDEWNELALQEAGLAGAFIGGWYAAPFVAGAVIRVGGTVVSWLCLNDGQCDNEIRLGLDTFRYASQYGIRTFNQLRYAVRQASLTGVQIHHIIEVRFANIIGGNTGRWSSVVLTPEEHLAFTNAWRAIFPHGRTDYATLTRTDIWNAAQVVYANYPELLEAARVTIFGP